MARAQQVALVALLLLLTGGGALAWLLAHGGVLCVPALSSPRGDDATRLRGTWHLESEPFTNELLVLQRDGALRVVSLTQALGPLAEKTRVRSRDWALDGGQLRLAGEAIDTWTLSGVELEVGDVTHRSRFRRAWCVGAE